MENLQLIEHIMRLMEEEENQRLKNDPTFFEIIGRSYDEDLISRMLLYVLQTDKQLVSKLLNYALNREDICIINIESAKCEQIMYNGRADIFVKAESGNHQFFTLTIENKIGSDEHDNQTTTYYKYISDHYKPKENNGFIYLKPKWSNSLPSCSAFILMDYVQFQECIQYKNSFAYDFIRHINKYFSKEYQMDNSELLLLKNFRQFKDLYGRANGTIARCIKNCSKQAELLCRQYGLTLYPHKKGQHLCKDAWYKKDEYYFYSEVYFTDFDPNEIYVKSVIRNDDKSPESKFLMFCNSNGMIQSKKWEKQWCINYEKKFESQKEMFSPDWKKELHDFIEENLPKMIEETDALFDEFQQFIKKNYDE